jgi:hypothetical protein
MNQKGFEALGISPLDPYAPLFNDLYDRVMELQAKQRANKRNKITLSQKILLLKTIGLMEKIDFLFGENDKKNKVKFLSVLLDGDFDNIHDYLTESGEDKMNILRNYEALDKLFGEINMPEQKSIIQPILKKLKRKG